MPIPSSVLEDKLKRDEKKVKERLYRVLVERTGYGHYNAFVNAKSLAEARGKALEKAKNTVISESESDYDITDVHIVPEKTLPKLVPYSEEWEKKANAEARCFCPDIYPCKKCGYPVISGYCCSGCLTSDPQEKE